MPTENCDHIWKDIEIPLEIDDQIFVDKSWRQCIKCDTIGWRPEIFLDWLNRLRGKHAVEDFLKKLRDIEEKCNLRNKQLGTIRYYEYEFKHKNIFQAKLENATFEEKLSILIRLLEEIKEIDD